MSWIAVLLIGWAVADLTHSVRPARIVPEVTGAVVAVLAGLLAGLTEPLDLLALVVVVGGLGLGVYAFGGSPTQGAISSVNTGQKALDQAKADLAKVTVTAEILQDLRGPNIVIQKFKNKTGYKKRQGHRQKYTQVKVTDISL